MQQHVMTLAQQVIARHQLRSIEDVMRVVPIYMCHVLQESAHFQTWPSYLVQLKFPEEEWAGHIARYERYRDEIIPGISVEDYLGVMLQPDIQRLPCFCSEMANVAGVLVSQILGKPVYALRNIFVNYLYLPQRWHCINAVVENDRIRYFDTSAYAQVFDKKTRKVMLPTEMPGFNAAHIAPELVHSDRWLQKEPFQRQIELVDGQIADNFSPSPLPEKPRDEFLRVFS